MVSRSVAVVGSRIFLASVAASPSAPPVRVPVHRVRPSVCLIRGHAAETNGSKAQAPSTTHRHTSSDRFSSSLASPIDPVCLYASLHALIPSFLPSIHPSLPYKRRTRRSCLLAIHPLLLARSVPRRRDRETQGCMPSYFEAREGGRVRSGWGRYRQAHRGERERESS